MKKLAVTLATGAAVLATASPAMAAKGDAVPAAAFKANCQALTGGQYPFTFAYGGMPGSVHFRDYTVNSAGECNGRLHFLHHRLVKEFGPQ